MEAHQTPPYYLDPRKVGEALREVALELINVEDQEVQSRWFHSEFETDLFIWSDLSERIIKQQISFYGQIVEWNFVDGTRTGYVVEDEAGAQDIKASETVHFDKDRQIATVNMAIQILEHVKMDSHLKLKLITHFQGPKPKKAKKSKLISLLNRFRKR